jgi:hypothetical protein
MDAKKLLGVAQDLFGKKSSLNSLHQEVAENFYPERADFTTKRSLGTDFAANINTSYPVLCRRDLANSFSMMLRPTAKPWFHIARRYQDKEDNEIKQWLQKFEIIQRRAMYDPDAMFTRATKEGDNDFSAFGQCAISIEVVNNKRNGPHLLYRNWHLRDVCWQENERGQIGPRFRKWKPTVLQVARTFGDKAGQKVLDLKDKTPFEELELMHMVVEEDMYDDNSKGRPWWSIWYNITHDALIEAVPIWNEYYAIPRWQTVSGSQYSYSPATVAALPDGRLLQAMTYTLLEAGEKATNPPLIATQEAIKSDVSTYAGGLTWVDFEYDERLGEALRPITQDFRGFNFGMELNQNAQAMIKEAFFLNTLKMPERAPEMTAYEVGQRVQEYIRNALPLFEPMENEYNAKICDLTFDILMRNLAFGSPLDFPKKLSGSHIEFNFESPLHDAVDSQKGQLFQQAQQLIAAAVAMDPSVSALPDAVTALRDALNGIGVPANWMHNEDYVAQAKQQQLAQQGQQQLLANMEQGSNIVKNIGGAQAIAPGAQSTGTNG